MIYKFKFWSKKMITATVSTNEYGQITFPAWFFEKIGVKQGSPLTINFDENGRSVEFLPPNTSNEEQTETKSEFKSGFGMVKTHLSAKDLDVDVAQFARDIL
ncbi:AbrB/MazE/SpoVT family DNA-binding domain-containing protein [Moraxella bovis]|uniref:AbrB/MazE/SpoVT family DNA-binding domain-containing protein n=2 Tax=Moraxella bovis TaxID=476 RepID=A0AAQ2Q4B6_MORBO|nr:AbrB/MazE/SpoVT family DNA-binding domain-containing protein [Moraxella bovis]AWY19740.1 hypothetical protein DQF64_03990 [Moraxella bovis]UYZ75132.1 AbrB/MazE/SpoVT family DNA-binding domain-containing protein [Moraxella bovis]UYZ78936.1 AbrB/MazE/SpoVT family DNA-binding domain-containing protein [Moraxella bovis]UYZ80477.1 AbrB/MazE/SpoVT family DNA-binding domain-containing protein [Moraxella bovis]UYZ87419.1 AbrB/MazE/SpoVT family DNA-binding domain-containing protein [Moraxella bovis]